MGLLRFASDTMNRRVLEWLQGEIESWEREGLLSPEQFEKQMMDLAVNIPLEAALDLGWQILADCFEPIETGIPTQMVEKFWPRKTA